MYIHAAVRDNTEYFFYLRVNLEQSRAANTTEAQWKSIFSRNVCISVYSALVIATIFVSILRSCYFFTICMRSSTNLHNNMFTKIVYATMHFFNTNPSGRILNRFSKDMGAVDEVLPSTMTDVIQVSARKNLFFENFLSLRKLWTKVDTTLLVMSVSYCGH